MIKVPSAVDVMLSGKTLVPGRVISVTFAAKAATAVKVRATKSRLRRTTFMISRVSIYSTFRLVLAILPRYRKG